MEERAHRTDERAHRTEDEGARGGEDEGARGGEEEGARGGEEEGAGGGEEEGHHRAEVIARQPGEFTRVAQPLARWTGSPWAAAVAGVAVVVWLIVGFATDFPRAWELAVTTGVPLASLGLLIVIQHSQNHDDQAVQLKLDEVIRAIGGTSDAMMRVEEADTDELEDLQKHFRGHVDERASDRASGNGGRREDGR